MSGFITIKDDYNEYFIAIGSIALIFKANENVITRGNWIHIELLNRTIALEYNSKEERDEAYKEIKELITELTE